MHSTITRRFYAPGLSTQIKNLRCEVCHINKAGHQQYGHLPERHVDLEPWYSVTVDLIGPWKLNVLGREIKFNALTCIDPVTNLVEICCVNNKTSAHITNKFENLWLSRYPKPIKCIHDQDGEFVGFEFQQTLQQHGVHDASATSKNPTANAISKRMYQVVGNILHTRFNNNNMIPDFPTATQAVDDALAACVHATRYAVSKSLQNNTPDEVVFGRNMLPLIVDLENIRAGRQLQVNGNLRQTNAKRQEFEYIVGRQVLQGLES